MFVEQLLTLPGSANDTDLQILELTTRLKDIEGKQDNFCEQFDDLTEELERMTEIYECINRTILRSKEETRNKFLFKQKTIQQKQPGSCAYFAKVFKDESDL